MNKILNTTFVGLGIIFSILIIGAMAIFLFTQYGPGSFSRAGGNANRAVSSQNNQSTGSSTQQDSYPSFLSASQRAALESFGIDPNSIPQTLTGEQMACFETALGAGRVAEIKAGASPTAMEFFKAKGCI